MTAVHRLCLTLIVLAGCGGQDGTVEWVKAKSASMEREYDSKLKELESRVAAIEKVIPKNPEEQAGSDSVDFGGDKFLATGVWDNGEWHPAPGYEGPEPLPPPPLDVE